MGVTAETVRVPMAEFRIDAGNHAKFSTSGVGSCVAVCALDTDSGIAGMLHAALPLSQADSDGGRQQPAMYVDTGIVAMRNAMIEAGASPQGLQAWLLGGASVIASDDADLFRMGKRNVTVAIVILAELEILLAGEDTGGRHARSVDFFPAERTLNIRTAGSANAIQWDSNGQD